ncbi:FecR family protein [Pedobacter gandavensis]|uniref:FecR family protein n=1 Tax=Pedobacter gandavensis TaxID=2679963 RepID=UPI00292F9EE6|nr:FecR domain-containing protein [Pedobacter gandavensis]
MKNDRLFESLNIAELIVRKKTSRLKPGEEQALKNWADLSEENAGLYAEITEGKGLGKEIDNLNKYNAGEAFAKFQDKISKQQEWKEPQDLPQDQNLTADQHVRKLRNTNRFLIGIAASLFLFVIAGLGYYFYEKDSPSDLTATNVTVDQVLPGNNQAVLTLANGKEIQLSDAKNGELAVEGDVKVNKTKDGALAYTASLGNTASALNKIETQKGGMYQVTLPDGTNVWLNAASSLEYPVTFNGLNQRRVKLSGEAYFEIAKQQKPFIVNMNGEETEVLGTHFNINCYPDEAVIRTTLMEGSLKVSIPGTAYSKVLKPGYQTVLGKSVKGIALEKADLEATLAWKNGTFVFVDDDLETIMRELARWYNIEVEFADPEKRKVTFGGSISRFSDLNKVLKKLELTGLAKFKLEGRKLIVQ